jgi:hypothetical protein
MKILKNLFYATLLLSVTGEIFRIELSNNIALRPLDISVLACFLIYIYLHLKNKAESIDWIGKAIIFFTIIGFISLVLNSYSLQHGQLFVSFLYLLRWISYASIYFIVRMIGKTSTSTVEWMLILIGFIVLGFGYLQYFLYPNLRNLFYLGWDEHNYRMFSVFLDPNYAGCFFVLYVIFLLGLAHYNLKKKLQTKTLIIFLGIILSFPAIFLSYSRSALLMVIVSSVLYIFLIKKKKLIFLFSITFLAFLTLLYPTFDKENTNLFRKKSSFARIESYERSLNIIKDHLLIGVGFNAYRYAAERYETNKQKSVFLNHAGAGSDSSLLFVFATTGIVGLLIYINMWVKVFQEAFIKYNKVNNTYAIIVICSVTGLFINSLFINSLFFPVIMLWTWVIIGIMKNE